MNSTSKRRTLDLWIQHRTGLHPREFEQGKIDEMLKMIVIETAQMKWAVLFVFVLKKDGYLRFCVDYQKHNAIGVMVSYPLQIID